MTVGVLMWRQPALPGGLVWRGPTGEILRQAALSPGSVAAIVGPPGAPGNASATFTHVQSVPSAEWIINHNQGRFVDLEVTDLAMNRIGADVARPTVNQARVRTTQPSTGMALIH
jgi:hypothetical protein